MHIGNKLSVQDIHCLIQHSSRKYWQTNPMERYPSPKITHLLLTLHKEEV